MEPEGLLLYTQWPTAAPYPDTNASSPHLLTRFPKIRYNLLPSTPRSSEWYLPFRFPNQNILCIIISPMRAAYPTHFSLLDFMTLIISGEAYKLRSSSLCSLLLPLTAFSFIVPRSRYNRIMHREYSAGEMCHEICQFRYRCKFDYHKENDEYRYQEGCHNCEHQLR